MAAVSAVSFLPTRILRRDNETAESTGGVVSEGVVPGPPGPEPPGPPAPGPPPPPTAGTAALAGVESVLPPRSVAATRNVCEPAPTVIASGLEHAAGAAPSSAQANVDPGSLEANWKLTPPAATGPDSALVIVVCGAMASARRP